MMLPRAFLSTAVLLRIPNYSCSLPTGTTPGKYWRRAAAYRFQEPSDQWLIGQYGEPFPEGHELQGRSPIRWWQVVVTDAPRFWPRDVVVARDQRPEWRRNWASGGVLPSRFYIVGEQA
ncbi:hypothetical protein [Sphingomonas sp. SRS2]|uniref:hypothetical protein n=1 Tax=Sphingomonas sp. SRS2 TaxID=133190 RepID=UPI000A914AE5|nr:hypothetical protein [Sphingomonas sp. SRS2]